MEDVRAADVCLVGADGIAMIPRVIHMVWLSEDVKPALVKRCMNSWRKELPEFQIREWSSRDFDFESMPPFVREAIALRKWAFATDYIRLALLHVHGGVYLDSDVYVRRDISGFLDSALFSFMEYHPDGFKPYRNLVDENGRALTSKHIPGMCIQAAFIGAEPGHPFLEKCLKFYENQSFVQDGGSLFNNMIAPDIFALQARPFGFRYKDEEQHLAEGMTIYPSSYVAGSMQEVLPDNYAIHCCAGSWRDYGIIKQALIKAKRFYNVHRYLT